jgi:hypothetical protein
MWEGPDLSSLQLSLQLPTTSQGTTNLSGCVADQALEIAFGCGSSQRPGVLTGSLFRSQWLIVSIAMS